MAVCLDNGVLYRNFAENMKNAMKTIKSLVLVLLLLPMVASAQIKSSGKSIAGGVEYEVGKYPLYDDKEAAKLWKMWIKKAAFTQDDYARVIALSDASFYYLTIELQNIISTTSSAKIRTQKALELDKGITSNMANFARTFANRMQNLGAQGGLSDENMIKLVELLNKKQVYRQLNQEVYHPSR